MLPRKTAVNLYKPVHPRISVVTVGYKQFDSLVVVVVEAGSLNGSTGPVPWVGSPRVVPLVEPAGTVPGSDSGSGSDPNLPSSTAG